MRLESQGDQQVEEFLDLIGLVVQTPSWGLGAWRQGGANPYWGHDVEGHDVEGDLVRSPSPGICEP